MVLLSSWEQEGAPSRRDLQEFLLVLRWGRPHSASKGSPSDCASNDGQSASNSRVSRTESKASAQNQLMSGTSAAVSNRSNFFA
jgi:hypothetical protein